MRLVSKNKTKNKQTHKQNLYRKNLGKTSDVSINNAFLLQKSQEHSIKIVRLLSMSREHEEKHVGLVSLYTSCWQAGQGWAGTHSNRELAPEVTIHGGEKAQGWGFLQGWDSGKVRGVQEEQASFLYLNLNLVRLKISELCLSPRAYQFFSFQGQKPTLSSSPNSHQYRLFCMLGHPEKAVSPLVCVAPTVIAVCFEGSWGP